MEYVSEAVQVDAMWGYNDVQCDSSLQSVTVTVGSSAACGDINCCVTIEGLQSDTAYDFRVFATNPQGDAPASLWLRGHGDGGSAGEAAISGCTFECLFTSGGAIRLVSQPTAPTVLGVELYGVRLQWDVPGRDSLLRTQQVVAYNVHTEGDGQGNGAFQRVTITYASEAQRINGVSLSYLVEGLNPNR